jgi:transcriptional regulator with XRE-family HTH domain
LDLRFVHLLSKDARRKIIGVMLARRSLRELSSVLDVTPTAISKYRSGATHPSDEVISRVLGGASRDELMEISRIVFDDLYSGFTSFVEWMREKGLIDGYVVERLRRLVERIENDLEVRRSKIVVR